MIKAVFFDVDGTLVSHKTKQVPESTRKCLKQLKEKGIKLYLSTGRHILELGKLPVKDIEFDGYITLNGQLCLDSEKQPLLRVPFGDEAAQSMIALFQSKKIPLLLVEEKSIYINFVNDSVRRAQSEVSTGVPRVADYDYQPIYQAITFCSRGEEQLLKGLFPDSCKIVRWSDYGVDIISAQSGKAAGIRHILKELNIMPEEAAAFGDAENDIEMLKFAGLGIAMGNAREEVKAAADYVTADVDDDGVEAALIHFHIL